MSWMGLDSNFRRLVIVIMTLFPWGLVHAKEPPSESIPPVIIPVSLKESGEIANLRIKVVDHNIYYFNLRFSFREKSPEDRARVRALTGGYEKDNAGKPLSPGVPTPVLLTVTRVDGQTHTKVYQAEIDPILTSWGGDNFKKLIGFSELPPGSYSVQMALHKAAPAFDGTPVTFSIGYDKFKVNFKPGR